MTANERIARLERGFAELARTVTAQLPIRADGPGARAVQGIHAEIQALDNAEEATRRRGALEAELAKLGSAA